MPSLLSTIPKASGCVGCIVLFVQLRIVAGLKSGISSAAADRIWGAMYGAMMAPQTDSSYHIRLLMAHEIKCRPKGRQAAGPIEVSGQRLGYSKVPIGGGAILWQEVPGVQVCLIIVRVPVTN